MSTGPIGRSHVSHFWCGALSYHALRPPHCPIEGRARPSKFQNSAWVQKRVDRLAGTPVSTFQRPRQLGECRTRSSRRGAIRSPFPQISFLAVVEHAEPAGLGPVHRQPKGRRVGTPGGLTRRPYQSGLGPMA